MRVLIVSNDLRLSSEIHCGLKNSGRLKNCDVRNWKTAFENSETISHDYNIVFVVFDERTNPDIQLSAVRTTFDGFLVVVGNIDSSDNMIHLLHQGADDFIDLSKGISNQLQDIVNAAKIRLGFDVDPTQTIGVMGSVGGVGTTTLAVNIASSLHSHNDKCALMEMVLPQGDVATHLGLQPNHTLQDLCLNPDSIDSNLLVRSMKKSSTGISVLPSFGNFEDAVTCDGPFLRNLLSLASQAFDSTVVDLGSPREFHQILGLLSDLTSLVIPVRLDFSAICRTRNMLDFLSKSQVKDSMIVLVGNRFGMAGELGRKEAEAILNRKLDATVSDDTALVNLAVNCGVPASQEKKTSRFSRDIEKLTGQLLDQSSCKSSPSNTNAEKSGRITNKGVELLKQTLGSVFF